MPWSHLPQPISPKEFKESHAALGTGTPLSARPTVFRSHSFTPGAFYNGDYGGDSRVVGAFAAPTGGITSPDTSPQSIAGQDTATGKFLLAPVPWVGRAFWIHIASELWRQ